MRAFAEVMRSCLLKKLRMRMFPRNAEVLGNTAYGHIAHKCTLPLHELLFCVGKVAPLNLPYGHILQGYLTPCSFVLGKLPFEVALCSHCLQRKFTPSWTTSMCWLRLLLDLTLWSHSVDFNPLFLCTSSWCCFNFSFVNICFSQMLQYCFKNLSSVFR